MVTIITCLIHKIVQFKDFLFVFVFIESLHALKLENVQNLETSADVRITLILF